MAKSRKRRFYRRYAPLRRFRRKSKQFSILSLAGLGIAVSQPVQLAASGDYNGALAELGARFTGYNYQSKTFDFRYALMNGYLPVVAGGLGSVLCTKVGINRQMNKLPFIGKWVKL